MFSSELCEKFKNTYFEEHLRTTASLYCLRRYLRKLKVKKQWVLLEVYIYYSEAATGIVCFVRGVLKNFVTFTEKQLRQSLFF